MKQQRTAARRRTIRSKAFFFAVETSFDVTCLTYAGLGSEEVAVHEVDRKRTHPVLDLV
jgi:hypothetical protein